MNSSGKSNLDSELNVAFMPTLCAAPLMYAHSHGYFEKRNLNVRLHRTPSWSGVKERLVHGLCDAAHMLSPMPFACRQGIDGPQSDLRLSLIQNISGQALTLSNKHLDIQNVSEMKGFTFGVPYRFSMHYYLLCHYLASHGLDPLKDVSIKEVAPPQMPFYIEKGWIDGIFAPEPFNQITINRGLGFIHTHSGEIWSNHPCCCFATHDRFALERPDLYMALIEGVLEAEHALHLAGPEQRQEIATEISAHPYLRLSDPIPVKQALVGKYADSRGDSLHQKNRMDFLPELRPEVARWIVAQMQRWGQLPGEINYDQALKLTIDGDIQELIQSMEFERPNVRDGADPGFEVPDSNATLEYVKSQPFSAYSEKAESLIRHELPQPTENRLKDIVAQLARVAAGHLDTEIKITSTGEMGHLERILQETIINLRFSHDALAEQVEHLDDQVDQRTNRLTTEIAFRKNVEKHLLQARSKADVATQAKSDFLATMSHEIRTPLTAILGYTDALCRFGDVKQAPQHRLDMLSSIRRNGNHLLELINDVLDLSRIEAGQVELVPTPSSPLILVREVALNLVERARAKGLDLDVECTSEIPELVDIDPMRFRQILTNLVGNAIKFTNSGGVTVRLKSDPESNPPTLVIDVEDTGIGIPESEHAAIFDPFTHALDQNVQRSSGTGLGLTICRRLVVANGGEISLVSGKEVGSVFSFTIPFSSTTQMWLPENGDIQIEQPSDLGNVASVIDLTGTRILIVEDTIDTRELLTLFLEDAGATVSVCEDGLDGIAVASAADLSDAPFHLILMDMRLPGLDGYNATKRLRCLGIQCPIIALTAYALTNDKQECLDAGCDAYVTKPINFCDLFEAIESQLPEGIRTGEDFNASANKPMISLKSTDERFLPMLEKYLSRLPGVLEQLESARGDGELDTVFSVVHRLRGTASNYGFPQISEAAGKCETLLREYAPAECNPDETLDALARLVELAIDSHEQPE